MNNKIVTDSDVLINSRVFAASGPDELPGIYHRADNIGELWIAYQF
jgi:hypothetical protein